MIDYKNVFISKSQALVYTDTDFKFVIPDIVKLINQKVGMYQS